MRLSDRSIVSAALTVLVGILAACAAPLPPAPQVDLAAEAQAIRDISARWVEYVANRDTTAILALLADDAVFLGAGEPPREGLAAIQASTEAEFASYPDMSITWSPSSVQVAASADMAWERGTYQFDPDGGGPAEGEHGEYVTLYRKVDGIWKVALDIGVNTEPEAAPDTTE